MRPRNARTDWAREPRYLFWRGSSSFWSALAIAAFTWQGAIFPETLSRTRSMASQMTIEGVFSTFQRLTASPLLSADSFTNSQFLWYFTSDLSSSDFRA